MGKTRRKHEMETKKAAVSDYYQQISIAEICRKYEISAGMLYKWKASYDKGQLNGNASRERQLEEQVSQLERMVGRLTMENDILKKAKEYFHGQAMKRENSLPRAKSEDGQSGMCVGQ